MWLSIAGTRSHNATAGNPPSRQGGASVFRDIFLYPGVSDPTNPARPGHQPKLLGPAQTRNATINRAAHEATPERGSYAGPGSPTASEAEMRFDKFLKEHVLFSENLNGSLSPYCHFDHNRSPSI